MAYFTHWDGNSLSLRLPVDPITPCTIAVYPPVDNHVVGVSFSYGNRVDNHFRRYLFGLLPNAALQYQRATSRLLTRVVALMKKTYVPWT